MTNIFVSVNYDSSSLIVEWYQSIKSLDHNSSFILVDNFSSDLERESAINICTELNIKIILSENVGYGRALNVVYKYILDTYEVLDEITVFSGNLDVYFKSLPCYLPKGNYVYVPKVFEGNRNRNPFLTKFQSRFLRLHRFSLKSKNIAVFKSVIVLLKITSFIPSKIWAIHGSLFCFNGRILNTSVNGALFNEKSFLYSEELEFASYIDNVSKSTFINTDIICEHDAHVSTSKLICSTNDFFEVWSPSFYEWLVRWGKS